MERRDFAREEHVYRDDQLMELINNAVRFFHGTPVYPIDGLPRFNGTGIYALYYTGPNPIYAPVSEANRLAYNLPIYVGKAVPQGWRRARTSDGDGTKASNELHRRISEHKRNIDGAPGLEPGHFSCRFVIFESGASDMIGTIEAALIKNFRPLWNTTLDGFGNHDPGKGRYAQAKSDWDVLHHHRAWANKCTGIPKGEQVILENIRRHFETYPFKNA